MTQETFEQMVERVLTEFGFLTQGMKEQISTRLRDELAKGQAPFAWHHPEEGLNYENHYAGNIPLYTHPFVAAPAVVMDFEPDAKRLALELECLLLDCKDMAAVSKWWDSVHEALEQHRSMLSAAPAAPADAVAKDAEKQRDELLAALEFAREKIAELHVEAGDGDCHYPIIDDTINAAMQGKESGNG